MLLFKGQNKKNNIHILHMHIGETNKKRLLLEKRLPRSHWILSLSLSLTHTHTQSLLSLTHAHTLSLTLLSSSSSLKRM